MGSDIRGILGKKMALLKVLGTPRVYDIFDKPTEEEATPPPDSRVQVKVRLTDTETFTPNERYRGSDKIWRYLAGEVKFQCI